MNEGARGGGGGLAVLQVFTLGKDER